MSTPQYNCKIHDGEKCELFKVTTEGNKNNYTEACIHCQYDNQKEQYIPMRILVMKAQQKLQTPADEYEKIVKQIDDIYERGNNLQLYLDKIKNEITGSKEVVVEYVDTVNDYCDKIAKGEDQENLQKMQQEIANCTLYNHTTKMMTLKNVKDFNGQCKDSEDNKRLKQQVISALSQKNQITSIANFSDAEIKRTVNQGQGPDGDDKKIKELQDKIKDITQKLEQKSQQAEQLQNQIAEFNGRIDVPKSDLDLTEKCGPISVEKVVKGQIVQLYQCYCETKHERITVDRKEQQADDNYEDPQVFENLVGNNPFLFRQGDEAKKICLFRRYSRLGNTFWVLKNKFKRFEGYETNLKLDQGIPTKQHLQYDEGVLLLPSLKILNQCGQVGSAYYCVGDECQNRGQPDKLKLWGVNPYTHDSNYCNVAKHFGVDQQTGGFIIKGEKVQFEEPFTGAQANGILSKKYKAMKGHIVY